MLQLEDLFSQTPRVEVGSCPDIVVEVLIRSRSVVVCHPTLPNVIWKVLMLLKLGKPQDSLRFPIFCSMSP